MKTYANLQLDIVLIENVDVITTSPFEGVDDGFDTPGKSSPAGTIFKQ